MNIKTLALFLSFSLCALAGPTNYFGTVLLTDGISLLPNVAVPTPAEVSAAMSAATTAATGADSVSADAIILDQQAAALSVRVAALDGAQIVYGACVSFGSQAVEVNTNATVTTIGMDFPSNTVSTTYVELYVYYSEPMAGVGIQTASTPISATWADVVPLETELTTYPVAGQPVECYRMLTSVPADVETLFLRASGELRETVVGQFNVFESLTVNGVRGLTTTNAIGIHIDGLLVEALSEGGE